MSYFILKGRKIYYEVHGQGTPLVLLNGIMMSTASWKAFVDVLSANYKLILMDFFDQGLSDSYELEYDQSIQVEAVLGLFNELEIENAHLAGVSYGGEISMQFTLLYPERVKSLYLANTTAWTFPALQAIGDSWIHAAKSYKASAFFKTAMPLIYSNGFYEKHENWLDGREKAFAKILTPDWFDGFARLVQSADQYDIREEIKKIACPTMVVSASDDVLTPPECQKYISKCIEGSSLVTLENCGHAAMYESPEGFASTLLGFLQSHSYDIRIL